MRNKKATTKTDNNGVVWTFHNGQQFVAELVSLSEDMIRKLAIHGMKQKLSDSYAGKEVSVSQAFSNVRSVFDMLKDDEWTSGVTRTSILARAISRLTSRAIEDCIETLANLDKEELAELRKSPKVRSMIAEIQLDDAKDAVGPDFDLDAMFEDDEDSPEA